MLLARLIADRPLKTETPAVAVAAIPPTTLSAVLAADAALYRFSAFMSEILMCIARFIRAEYSLLIADTAFFISRLLPA